MPDTFQVIWNKYIFFLFRCRGGNLSEGMVTMLKCVMVDKKGRVLIVFSTGTWLSIALNEY